MNKVTGKSKTSAKGSMGRTRARAYNGGLGAVPSVEEPLVRGRGTKSMMMMMIKLKAY